ncbi:MAG: TonB-dependent receptor [Chthoniobacterales bacterium]|nr:TonB-dependent receptor [Chthoniobacterales bacterium]
MSAATANAQVAATATRPSAQASPTPSATPSAEGDTVERIIVTANKREEDVRAVPASITAFDDVELENLHATDLADYAAYIPSLQVNSIGAPGRTTIALRGIAALSSGSTVGTYIDETPVGASGLYQTAVSFQLDLLPYDIRRVEVLRGPQGTLYGANSIGGLIKYVTLDPSLNTREFHVGGGLSGTENAGDPGWDVHAVADLPLVQEHLGVRVSYARNELPGFIDNVANGQQGINAATQQSGHIAVLWKPIEAITVRLSAFGQRIESDNNAIVALDPVTERPLYGDLKNRVDVNEPFKKDIGLIALTVDWDLGWATITSASSYADTTTNARLDVTQSFGQYPLLVGAGPAGLSGFDLGLNLKKFTQELRLTSSADGPFLWQLGGFYTYEDANQTQFAFLNQLDGTPYPGLALLADLSLPSTYEEEAVFANATYKFTHWFSLGAGLRYSHNDQTFSQNFTGGALIPIGITPGSSSEDIVNFLVTPQFQLWKDGLLYGRIATGYQPGGPNVALPGVPPAVASSSLLSYEAGLKSDFVDHRIIFDITGYHLEWTDIQIPAVVNNIGVLANGGQATSNGVELSLAFRPITGLQLGLNGSYTDSTFDNDAPSLSAKAGDRLPNIPQWQGSITADYYRPLWGAHSSQPIAVDGRDGKTTIVPGTTQSLGWTGHLGLGVRLVGDRRSTPTAGQSFPLDSYGALDLNADISNDHWTVRVFAKNVTDERAYQNIDGFATLVGTIDHLQGVPIQPRTVGVEVDFKF